MGTTLMDVGILICYDLYGCLFHNTIRSWFKKCLETLLGHELEYIGSLLIRIRIFILFLFCLRQDHLR